MDNGWQKRQRRLKRWVADIWDDQGDSRGRETYLAWHEDFLDRFYRPPPGPAAVLLDVGCGYMLRNFHRAGRLQNLTDRLGAQYVGVDPERDWFDVPAPGPLGLCQGLGENLPFVADAFDAVFCLGVLDHVRHPDEVLREIGRVLKVGGAFWFANSYVRGSWWQVGWEMARHRLGLDESHRFVWTPRGLERLVRRAGFRIVRTGECPVTTSHYIEARHP